MVKHTDQTNVPIGEYDGFLVYEMPYFVYEITLNQYWDNGYCNLSTKYYISDKLLPIKKCIQSKRNKDNVLRKEICLIGVPKEFMQTLPIHQKTKKKNGTRRSHKGSVH